MASCWGLRVYPLLQGTDLAIAHSLEDIVRDHHDARGDVGLRPGCAIWQAVLGAKPVFFAPRGSRKVPSGLVDTHSTCQHYTDRGSLGPVALRPPERQDLPEQHVGQAVRRDPRGYTATRRREQAREEAAARRRRAAALAELQEDEELFPRLIDVTFICAGPADVGDES